MKNHINLSTHGFDVEPVVYWEQGCADVQCVYWNMWQGLVREIVRITFEGQKVKEITGISTEVLYAHDCGIVF